MSSMNDVNDNAEFSSLTVRGYLAVQILQGILANQLPTPEEAAKTAVGYADALLVELRK